MLYKTDFVRRPLICVAALLYLSSFSLFAQQPGAQTPKQDEDVLRISTDLVQTDVMVFDKSGHFVENLKPEQFDLRVDGKPQTISFFERVTAGSASERAQLAAIRDKARAAGTEGPPQPPAIETAGRTIIFFVDDLHLTPQTVFYTRRALLDFINKQMSATDQVLIASASGQLGFLQQLTDNKEALRTAVEHIKYQSRSQLDASHRPMTEYQASAIARGDRDVLDYKINEVMVDMMIPPSKIAQFRASAESEVLGKARSVLQQAASFNRAMFDNLNNLVRASQSVPGRKLLFFLSNGFVIETKGSDARDKLNTITDAAAKSGVVIYTIDVRGLFTTFADASTDVAGDRYSDGRTTFSGLAMKEAVATQEPLRVLAADTGGRAILNTNNIDKGVAKALEETSAYYLLAWQPEKTETAGPPKFKKIEISVKGRPDLTVQMHSGFLSHAAAPAPKAAPARNASSPAATSVNAELNAALNSPFPRADLPISLYPVFTNEASGPVLTISMQLPASSLGLERAGDKQKAEADVAYVVLDESGHPVSSNGRTLGLTGAAQDNASLPRGSIRTSFTVPITTKGLYQVRVAARDSLSHNTGTAYEWIKVPELKPGSLALSSLLISERKPNSQAQPDAAQLLNVDRLFARDSNLFLQLYVYNAAHPGSTAPPDVTMEIQVLRDNSTVMGAPAHPLSLANATDLTRIRYAAEIPLARLPAGLYTLQVTARRSNEKSGVSQQLNFMVK